jgi:hypothetical protein
MYIYIRILWQPPSFGAGKVAAFSNSIGIYDVKGETLKVFIFFLKIKKNITISLLSPASPNHIACSLSLSRK